MYDSYEEDDSASRREDDDKEGENEGSWIQTEDEQHWRGLYTLQRSPAISTFNSFQALEDKEGTTAGVKEQALHKIEIAKMYSKKIESACGKACSHGCAKVNIEELIRQKMTQGEAKKKRHERRNTDSASLNILSNQEADRGGREVYSVSNANKRTIWKKIEAAVDSGACDNVGNPRDFPGIEVKGTAESKSDDPKVNSWVGAGGDGIPKLGEMKIPCVTHEGKKVVLRIKAGDVNKTLISVSRLQEAGFDTNFTKHPHLRNTKTGEKIHLMKKGGMFILTMWIKIGEETSQPKNKDNQKDFRRQGK